MINKLKKSKIKKYLNVDRINHRKIINKMINKLKKTKKYLK